MNNFYAIDLLVFTFKIQLSVIQNGHYLYSEAYLLLLKSDDLQ